MFLIREYMLLMNAIGESLIQMVLDDPLLALGNASGKPG
jgi:hypothetical protein